MTTSRRDQFIALVRPAEPWPGAPSPEVIADALLPVVDRMIRQAQAEALESAAEAMSRPDEGVVTGPWRVGEHYGIHVYEGDRPVATFHQAEDAERCVAAVNANGCATDEFGGAA